MKRLRPIASFALLWLVTACSTEGGDVGGAGGGPDAGGEGFGGNLQGGTGASGGRSTLGGQSSASGGTGGSGATTAEAGSGAALGGAGGVGGTLSLGGGAGMSAGGGANLAGAASGGTGTSTGGGTGGLAGGAGAGGSAGGSQVELPAGVAALFPPPNATGVCPDPPLRVRFGGAPSLGTSGRIQVLDGDGDVVAAVDMAKSTVTDTLAGTTFTMQRPVFVDGDEVVVYLKNKALARGKTYSVRIDAGAIRAPGGGDLVIDDEDGWRFTTAAAPDDLSDVTVALDGSGDFCTLQGPTDAVSADESAPARITLEAGVYHEIVHVKGKRNLTIRGEDRKKTVIAGTNNDNLNPGTKTRALLGFDDTSGLVIENLTIHNLTPQGGSQAEALRLQGCDKCIVRNADILSLQDTLLFRGRIYVKNSYIAGNVDYIWGDGVAYFDQCEIRTVGRSGVIVQARNAPSAYGFVFVDSKLTAEPVATNNVLARIDASVYPGSHVAFVDCQMSNVAPAGWTITGGAAPSTLRFWEYGSRDASGNPIDVSRRAAGSARMTPDQAAKMRDVSVVLNGWVPE